MVKYYNKEKKNILLIVISNIGKSGIKKLLLDSKASGVAPYQIVLSL